MARREIAARYLTPAASETRGLRQRGYGSTAL